MVVFVLVCSANTTCAFCLDACLLFVSLLGLVSVLVLVVVVVVAFDVLVFVVLVVSGVAKLTCLDLLLGVLLVVVLVLSLVLVVVGTQNILQCLELI